MDGCDRCARGGAYITIGTEAQKAVRCQLWAGVVGSSPACSIFYEKLKRLLSYMFVPKHASLLQPRIHSRYPADSEERGS